MKEVCNHVRFYNREMIRHLSGDNLRPPESWKPAVESISVFKEYSFSQILKLLNEQANLFCEKLSSLEAKQTEENIRRTYKIILFDVSYLIRFKDFISKELITAIHILLSLYYFNPSLAEDETIKVFLKTILDKDLKLD